jgi:hypothetical protein
MENLFAQYRALPRAARWALLATAGILLYFLAVEPTLDATNRLNVRADQLALGLRQEAALKATDSSPGRAIADGLQAFGQPVLPTDKAAAPDAIHRIVDAVLTRHGITKRTKNERLLPIRGDELTALLGPGTSPQMAVDRLVIDITFDAAPETVVAILGELEQAHEITAIARVEMRKADAGRSPGAAPESSSRIVKATISPEAWIAYEAPAGGGR